MILTVFAGKLVSQDGSENWLTPGGIFDVLYDNQGNQYQLTNLSLTASHPLGGNNSVNSAPNNTCSAGYFNIYFAANSVFDGAGATPTNMRAIVCQVFTDLTGLISSPLSPLANTGPKVNIFCGNTTNTTVSGPPGEGSPFYCFPAMPTNTNQGIADNQIYKMISSGSNPYSNLPTGLFYNGGNFYHGFINANPSYTANFSLNTGILNINSTDYDFYTIMLHEVMHALGFITLISSTGLSQFGQFHNYYSRYDTYLQNSGGTPLLTSTTAPCTSSNLYFQGSVSDIHPGTCPSTVVSCNSAAKYVSTNVNVKVFTPDCYLLGSSLSHFNDVCSTPASFTPASSCTAVASPSNSGLYFLMSYAVGSGSCFVKRYPKAEERFVLCDIGYSVNTTYTSTALLSGTLTSHSYGGSSCPGSNIWGVNDGISGSVYTYTTTGNTFTVPISTIIANDASATTTISCLEVVYSNATLVPGPTNLTLTATAGSGLVILKYLPVNSGGSFGNATYIFVYFIPSSCNPPSACNMVQNSGFENLAAGLACGEQLGPNGVPPGFMSQLSCWDNYQPNPDLYTRGCTTGTLFNLGNNTRGTIPPIDSYNGFPNDRVVGILQIPNGANEVLKNNLSSPLIPGNSYQISFLVKNYSGIYYATSTSSVTVNPNVSPIVLSFASYSTFAFVGGGFPSGLSPLISFTIPANTSTNNVWTSVTSTFVCPSTPNAQQYALMIGMHPANTALLTGSTSAYCFLDEVFISPVPTESFSIPTATACGYTSYTNLAQYASTTGTFTGTGVTFTAGQFHFNSPQILNTGTYPVAFTYSANGCLTTLWQNITVSPSFTVTPLISGTTCINFPSSITLNGVSGSNPSTFTWQPGNLIGSLVTVTPTIFTTYTVYASDVNNCTVTNTLSVPFVTNCCEPAFNTETISVVSASLTTISGPIAIINNPTVQSGAILDLTGKIVFPANASITINAGGTLRIKEAHLKSCGSGLWHGIIVNNNGRIICAKEPPATVDNLIEDAIIAIDITSHSTSSVSTILELNNTTFNKNHISLNIANFQTTLNTNPFIIDNCVFTCRDFSSAISNTTWPQVTTNTFNTSNLRTAVNSTTGLVAPYLAQTPFIITNLKAPYTGMNSHIAIQLENIGVTSATAMYGIQIGDNSSASGFNLFDAHDVDILAINSNIKTINSVHQNTQAHSITLSQLTNNPIVPAAAVLHFITGNLNANLNMTPASPLLRNAFWNCYRGIYGNKTYRFNIENAIFRSTQSTNLITGINWGNTGILMASNRVQYYIKSNEFTNIANCINIPLVAGTYTSLSTCSICVGGYGIYAANIAIVQNTFSAGSASTNYVDKAISITCPNQTPWWIAPDYTATPLPEIGTMIVNNVFDKVYRGAYVQGHTGFRGYAYNNNVSLIQDNAFGLAQHGIDFSNNLSAGNNWYQYRIFNNNLGGVGTNSTSNSLASLVYCNYNIGFGSPSVTCNNTRDSYNGFVFSGLNTPTPSIPGTRWFGNDMENLYTGMLLTYTGVIGPQGYSTQAIGNRWNGTWPGGGSSHGIYTFQSTVTASPLWVVATGTPNSPPNPFGNPNGFSYAAGSISVTSIYSLFECIEPSDIAVIDPIDVEYEDEEMAYIANTTLYRYLHLNDSLRTDGSDLQTFYEDQEGSTIDKLMQVEQHLFFGEYEDARTILSVITPDTDVEQNYFNFYSLYSNYEEAEATEVNFSSEDSTELYEIAILCPEVSGACVHQARALYNAIYKLSVNFPECGEVGARSVSISTNTNFQKLSNIDIFPNPSTGQISILFKSNNEIITLIITDLTGRILKRHQMLSTELPTTLSLDLLNGVYLASFTNSKNETVTKILLISR